MSQADFTGAAPAYPVAPTYGQPVPGADSWPTYDPAAYATPNIVPYPAMPYPQPVGMLVPGQVVPTAYGTFMVGSRSKIAAGLLGIFLGGLGVGRFYRGDAGIGVAQLLVTIFTAGLGGLWGLIDGIVVLASQPGQPGSLDASRQLMI